MNYGAKGNIKVTLCNGFSIIMVVYLYKTLVLVNDMVMYAQLMKGRDYLLHAAIIGCGAIASVHACALALMQDVELTACADLKFERAQKLAAENGANAYASMEELLDNHHIDVVHLCTPHHLHAPMAALAASHGIHVFTEKPPVIDREQWLSLVNTAEAVQVGVCFQNRYNGSVQKIKELLKSGNLGKVLGARAFVTWSRGKEYYTQSGWRGCLKTEGGGVLINQAIHTLDLLVYLLGKPEHVASSTANRHLQGVIEVEDTVEAYMTIHGAPVLFYATNAYCANSPVLVEIECENAIMRMEKDVLTLHMNTGKEERFEYQHNLSLSRDYWGAAHVPCIRAYYDALLESKPVPIGLEQVKDSVDTMLKIYGR